MPNLNKVMLIGNCTREPEVKFIPSGKAVCQFGLAINHSYKTEAGEKREEVTFVDIEAWGRLAEIIGEYVKKGKPVFIEGRLKLETWDDKQSGTKRSKMKVVADQMQLLGGKDDRPPAAQQPKPQPKAPPRPQADPDLDAVVRDEPF